MKVEHLLLSDQFAPSSPSSSSLISSQTPTTCNSQHDFPRPPPPPIISSSSPTSTVAAAGAAIATELVLSPNSKSLETIKCNSWNPSAVSLQMQMQSAGGTRWSPMPQQIKILEALYNGGMRTPNPVQIERITAELGKYGRIEGKNVFYWFQNHKARERQKQKRGALLPLASNSSFSPPPPHPSHHHHHHRIKIEEMEELLHGGGKCKRKCRRWSLVDLEGEDIDGDRTLKLFPLQPEYWKQEME